jgi:hypothetical protein
MVEGRGMQQRGMEEAPDNCKETSHSAHAKGMIERRKEKVMSYSIEHC